MRRTSGPSGRRCTWWLFIQLLLTVGRVGSCSLVLLWVVWHPGLPHLTSGHGLLDLAGARAVACLLSVGLDLCSLWFVCFGLGFAMRTLLLQMVTKREYAGGLNRGIFMGDIIKHCLQEDQVEGKGREVGREEDRERKMERERE